MSHASGPRLLRLRVNGRIDLSVAKLSVVVVSIAYAAMCAQAAPESSVDAFLKEVGGRLPSKGTVHAVYGATAGFGIRMVGYDIATGANYLALSGKQRMIMVKDSKGSLYHLRTPSDEDSRAPIVGPDRVGLMEPKVVNELLFVRVLQAKRFPQAMKSAVLNASNEWEIEFSVPGGAWFAFEDSPDVLEAISKGPRRPGWRFDEKGVLLPEVSRLRVRASDLRVTGEAIGDSPFQELDNDPRSDLSVRATIGGPSGFRLQSIEFIPEGRLQDFQVDAVLKRVKAVIPERESMVTSMPLDVLAKGVDKDGKIISYQPSISPASGDVIPFHRALIIAGVMTCALGLFAIWKKRA